MKARMMVSIFEQYSIFWLFSFVCVQYSIFICLLLAAVGLHCYAWAFSSCGAQTYYGGFSYHSALV